MSLGTSFGRVSSNQSVRQESSRSLIYLARGRIASMSRAFHTLESAKLPDWLPPWLKRPSKQYALGLFPTPIHRWNPPGIPEDVEFWIKRDDLTGMQLSGNKVRKLEFLIAEAMAQGADTLITIGGIQSNHCRATAVAARYAGLDCHLILRNSRQAAENDPGMVGNLLIDRMTGAHIHQVTKEEYAKVGGKKLGEQLEQQLKAQGRKPYVIPVGGSDSIGTFGYLAATQEILDQAGKEAFTDIINACGSGGTTAGLALGNALSGMGATIHAYGVCDDEDYFYDFIDGLYRELEATPDRIGKDARAMLVAHQAKGAGYAISKPEEMQTVIDVAQTTGIIFDSTYSGKAFHALREDIKADPGYWKGRKVLYIHTGGLFGLYSEASELQKQLEVKEKSHRLVVAAE
ncbi:g9743 [Coccomyxa viridis]|uniref:G9743 protein n=1 Tax=Coccomyxa viridis TaxID=1274662 RepID=A0ABP1G7X7_9CHLO